MLPRIPGFDLNTHWQLKIWIVCSLASLLFTYPAFLLKKDSLTHVIDESEYRNRVMLITSQIKEPLNSSVTLQFKPESHEAKRAFRLTVPLFGYLFGLSIAHLLFLEVIAGLLLVFLTQQIVFNLSQSKTTTLFITLGLAFTPFLKYAFYDELFFDPFAYFLIALLLTSANPILCYMLSVMAFFVDERALICLFCGIAFLFSIEKFKNYRTKLTISILLGILTSFTIRLYLSQVYHFTVPIGEKFQVGFSTIICWYKELPIALFTSFEIYWLVIPYALWIVYHERNYILMAAYISLTGLVLLTSSLIFDVTRSSLYGFPLIFGAMGIICQKLDRQKIEMYSTNLAIVSFIIPSYFYILGYERWMSKPYFSELWKLLGI